MKAFNYKSIFVFGFLFIIMTFTINVAEADQNLNNNNLEQINEYIETEMQRYNIPGLALGIIKDGEIIHLKGYGRADETGRKVTPETPFLIGSLSKSFTALGIMQLVEEKKINLNESVKEYLPWFELKNEEASEKITVENLLRHTSGFSTYQGFEVWRPHTKSNFGKEDIKENLKDIELAYNPGEKYKYSNANYIILGQIIEEVSGKTYSEYIKKNIFEPLDMENSYVSVKEAVGNNLATGYRSWFGFNVPYEQIYPQGAISAGYIISSAEDMTKYLRLYLNKGKYRNKRIISEFQLNKMFQASPKHPGSYGLGWGVMRNSVGHTGENSNFSSHMRIDFSNNNLAYIILYNIGDQIVPRLVPEMKKKFEENLRKVLLYDIELSRALSNRDQFYLKFNSVVGLIVFVLILIFAFEFKRWKRKDKKTKSINILNAIVFHLLLPGAIIIILPRLLGVYNIKQLLHWLPDIAWVLILISLFLLSIGGVKGYVLFKVYTKEGNE